MRPTPIPDAEVPPGVKRIVMAAPNGDLTDGKVAPVEALVSVGHEGQGLVYSSRCVLEEGDLVKLAEGGTVWITFWGAMVPWAVEVCEAVS